MNKKNKYQPGIITHDIFNKLFNQEKPALLTSLYCFYVYTALWQKTNQIKCTTQYTSKGMEISTSRVRKEKKRLIELGFIEDVVTREKGTVTGHYIKLKYATTLPKNHTVEKTTKNKQKTVATLPKNDSVEKRHPNALSNNNKMLSVGTPSPRCDFSINTKTSKKLLNTNSPNKIKWESKCVNYLFKALKKKNKIFRTPKNNQWQNQLIKFIQDTKISKKYFVEILKWYCSHIGEEYIVKAYSMKTFCDKFQNIIDAKEKYEKDNPEKISNQKSLGRKVSSQKKEMTLEECMEAAWQN